MYYMYDIYSFFFFFFFWGAGGVDVGLGVFVSDVNALSKWIQLN